MPNLNRLNGWQRLWLVAGAAYFVVVAAATLHKLPFDLTIPEYLQDASLADETPHPANPRFFVQITGKWLEVEKLAHNEQTKEWIYLKDGSWSEPSLSLEYAKLPHALSESELKRLRTKQITVVGQAAALWLIPWLLLYAAGAAVAWVRAGFQSQPHRPEA